VHFSFDRNFGPPISDRAIFAVDDDRIERALFLQMLREAGVKNPCRFFSNGEEMIEALLTVLKGAPPPLLCFLDLRMPGMCGLDVLRWIRLQDALTEVSVVMLSPAEDRVALNDVLRCGAQCCAKKFPDAAQLRRILDEAEKFATAASGRSAFDLPCNLLRAAQPVAS
jgi:CheY-like chemotaxis protein